MIKKRSLINFYFSKLFMYRCAYKFSNINDINSFTGGMQNEVPNLNNDLFDNSNELNKQEKAHISRSEKQVLDYFNYERNAHNKDKNTTGAKNSYNFKKILFGNNARETLSKGVLKVADSVKITYGPMGKNFAIDNYDNNCIITKDGVTVARYIDSNDRSFKIGISILNSMAGNTNRFVGDGTTTCAILGSNIIKRGLKLVNSNYDPQKISNGIIICKDLFQLFLKKLKKNPSKEEIYQLAMITTSGDKEISELVSEAINQAGKDGEILIEEGYFDYSFLVKTDSINFQNGMNKLLLNDEKEITIKNPLILIISSELKNSEFISNVINLCTDLSRSIILFSKNATNGIVQILQDFNKSSLYKVR